MQVQHEAQLIESNQQGDTNSMGLLTTATKHTLDSYTLISQSILSPIEHLVCCSQSNLVAVYLNGTNQIILIDTKTYLVRERFPLKACNKKFSKQSFTLKGIDFSPDGTRLAIGQTDCIIYIYRLASQQPSGAPASNGTETTTAQGSSSGSKPTITGKFVCSSPITCLIWTDYGIIFGTQDGKVKLISMPSKSQSESIQTTQGSSSTPQQTKVISLYNSPKGAMPISLAFRFPIAVIGFVDCNVQLVGLPADVAIPIDAASNNLQTNSSPFPIGNDLSITTRRSSTAAALYYQQAPASSIEHSCPPYFLSMLANTICCAGSDGRIALHSSQLENSTSSSINYGQQQPQSKGGGTTLAVKNVDLKEEIVAVDYSPINEVLAVATTTRLLFIKYDQESSCWQLQNSFIELVNAVSLTSVKWTKDGAQIVVGTLNGSLELFRCTWSKHSISEQLDICHIAKNRVRITDRARNLLATYKTQYDIKRVNLLDNGRSVIIWTSQSLLLARMGQPPPLGSSELQWGPRKRGVFKFCFDHAGFVLIYDESSRELLLVRLGQDSIAYRTKLDCLRKKLISVRQYPPPAYSTANAGRRTSEFSPEKTSPNSSYSRQRSAGSARSRFSSATGAGNREPADQFANPALAEASPTSSRGNLESISERLAMVQDSQSSLASGSSSSLLAINLKSNSRELSTKHRDQIVWLELSYTSNSLVFRDSQNRLYLIFLGEKNETAFRSEPAVSAAPVMSSGDKSTQLLLESCEFAKWLPESDILVGQSLHKISIWYNIEELNRVLVLDSRAYNITNSPPLLDLSLKHNQTLQDGNKGKHQLTKKATGYNDDRRNKPYPWILSVASSHLNLSNGVRVPLDKAKVRFYTEIAGSRLESALEVLEKEDPSKRLNGLWSSLGWIAIGRSECEIAVRAFRKLDHKSMVECLEKCLEQPDEREWRLAMLKGDWDTFERVAEADQIISTYKRLNKWSRALDYLTRTQQFRHRDLIEQEFRQWLVGRGRYLEGAKIQAKSGDLAGAIELLLENKKFEDAIELFVSELKSPILQNQRTEYERRLVELASRLKSHLVEEEPQLFDKAALVSEKILGNREEALELYLAGKAFSPALELARAIAPDRVANLEESYGDFLMEQFRHNNTSGQSRKQTLAAVDHYLASKTKIKALSAAIELMDFNRAFEVLKQWRFSAATTGTDSADQDRQNKVQIKQHSSSIAEFMLARGEQQKAIEALLVGEHYEQLIGLYIEQGDFKPAFEISLKFKHSNDRAKAKHEFLELARDRAENPSLASNTTQAEEIYLMLEEPDLAIEMQKKAKNYERMLGLVEQYQPDSFESCLLLLARELESVGRFGEAEKYLLRASDSEWTNVVRMYRLANKWEDAYRVARSHCLSEQDPLLVQLAYFWAKSLLTKSDSAESSSTSAALAAQNLLKRLQVLNLVVDFCCENKNFQLALEFLHQNTNIQQQQDVPIGKLKRDVIKRYAAFLEQQHKFDKAEELLLQHDQVEEAAKMYADNDLHSDAIRVVESRLREKEGLADERRHQFVELLQRTLVQCADRLASEVKPTTSLRRQQQLLLNGGGKFADQFADKLLAAQQMYLRAQRPELAVELYKERGMWQEAIQVAQRFAPQLLEGVEQALDSRVASDLAPIVTVAAAGSNSAANQQTRRMLRSSNKSSPMTSDNAALIRQHQAIGSPVDLDSRRQSQVSLLGQTIDYLRAKAELSMRRGDLKGTKQALAKFLDSLVDGNFQSEASLAQVNDWLAQLEHILTSCEGGDQPEAAAAASDVTAANGLSRSSGRGGRIRLDRLLLPRILALADRVAERCAWGQLVAEQQRQHHCGESTAWLRLRDILAACCARAALDSKPAGHSTNEIANRFGIVGDGDADEDRQYDDDSDEDDEGDYIDEQSLASELELQAVYADELDRRLLVAHYVTLHGSLVGQLQANLKASGGSLGLRTSKIRGAVLPTAATASGSQMPLSKVGRLRAEQPASADILDLLAKLSLSLLRYTDILEAKLAFYNAGFWLLANDRREVARFAWSRLVELSDGLIFASSSGLADELQAAGVPEEQRLVTTGPQGAASNGSSMGANASPAGGQSLSSVSQQQMQEVRSWLLEALIEAGGSGAISSSRGGGGLLAPLDERGEFESSLGVGRSARGLGDGARAQLPACLVSGYPVFANADRLILGPSQQAGDTSEAANSSSRASHQPAQVVAKYQARLSEWRRLVLLSRRFELATAPHSTRLIGRSQHQYPNERASSSNSGLSAPHANQQQQQEKLASGGSQTGAAAPLKDIVDFIVKLSGADTKVGQQI